MTTPLPPREAALPVIPRIVRRTRVDTDRAFLRPIGRAAKAAQRSSIGGIAIMALALATLGAVSGLGLRSLTDQALAPAATFEHTSDAAGVEHVLARASAAARQEGLAAASPPSTAPSPIAAPTPAAPTPVAASMASPSPSPGVPAPPASPSPAAHAAPRPTRAAHADAKVATSHPAARPLTPPHRSKHHASAALQARR